MDKLNKLPHHQFKTDVILKATLVKNWGSSSLCWTYATLGAIKSERLMMGDLVSLSVDYLVRMLLKEQARESFFAGGRKQASLRGTASVAPRLLEGHDMLHKDTCNGKQVDYNVLAGKMQLAVSQSASLQKMGECVDEILDAEVGFMPWFVFSRHAEYTPKRFTHSVCLPHECLSLTSFTHHPYGYSFALKIPDSRHRGAFMNVSLDTLTAHVKRALQTGHPICWEGDISKPGLSFVEGVAKLPNKTINVMPTVHQRQFETLKITSGHCMMLVGLARDRRGSTYYITKNSWSENNPFSGYMYLNDSYLRLKTVAVCMSQAVYGV